MRLLHVLPLLAVLEHASAIGIPKITSLRMLQPFPLLGKQGFNKMTLLCEASGNPMPTIKWKFNGKPLEGNRFFTFPEDGRSELNVRKITQADEGAYRCEATNGFGTIFNEINVKIYKMGKFNKPYTRYDTAITKEAHIGKPLELACPDHDEGIGNSYVWGSMPESGTPTMWRSGTEPIETGFYSTHGELVFSTLTRKTVKMINDMGGVSCILYRSEPVSSVQIRLDVRSEETPVNSKPQLRRTIDEEMVGVTGKTKEMICGAIGYPNPKVTWYKDDVEVSALNANKEGRNFTISGHGMVLTIRPITYLAEGKYKCVAENSEGKDEKQGVLRVHSEPYFKKDMEILNKVLYDQSLTLNCEGDGKPQVTFNWHFNGSILNQTDRYDIEEGKLTILKADFNHTGLYLCVVRNYLGVNVQPAYVAVDAIPPTLTKGLQNPTYIFKDEENILTCTFHSAPAPHITWYKDGSNNSISQGQNLVFPNVQDEDSGKYTCHAKNVKGEDQDEAEVIAVVKTVITKKPSKLTKKVGTKLVQLYCDAVYEDEKLQVTFQWLRDGKPLDSTEYVYPEKRLKGPSRIVFFKDLQMSAGGEYTCRVYTADGSKKIISEDTAVGSITVIGKPKSLMEATLIGDCGNSSNTLTLTWKQENYYGQQISHYILEFASKEKSGEDSWVRYDPDSKIVGETADIEVKKLPASADLKFRLKSVIEFDGETFISDPINIDGSCATPAGAPIWAPKIGSESSGPGTLTVTWNDVDDVMKSGPGFAIVVEYRKLPNGEVVTKTVTDGNKLDIENAGENENYEVIVYAKNDNGVGPKVKENLKSSGPRIDSAPENISVSFDDKTDDVIIQWDAVSGATKYKVYYSAGVSKRRRRRRDHHGIKMVEVVATNATLLSTDLKSQASYTYQIAGANEYMDGPKSPELTFQTKAAAPKAPMNANVNIIGHGIQVTWNPPVAEKTKVTGYVVTYYKKGDKSTKKTIECDEDCREIFITEGLDPFSYYTVELRAKNDIGEGAPRIFDDLVVSTVDVPGKPAPPLYVNLNETTMAVNFKLPSSGYVGGLPENFTIYYYLKGENENTALPVTAVFPSGDNITIHDVESKPYILYAVGINSAGTGARSDITERNPVKVAIPPVPVKDAPSDPFYEELWFLILIIIILLIILIALIICCCLSRRGGKYPVDEKEKERGGWDNAPLKDYSEVPMEDMASTPAKNGKGPIRSASQNSLKPPFDADEDDEDKDSLDDYGEDTKFNEDGSFIGQYGGEDAKKDSAANANGPAVV